MTREEAVSIIEDEVIGWVVHDFANAYMAERRKE